ncbi:unnamed protein product [Trifolium pratense]|uniref:Uncharacterized protein n=1 Tax=Trifolium pratense TaxID=57577 RepID=A0ACB0LFS5_TRIPR|nr:unnamed protein product [Trifolium pratense]
MVMLQSYSSFTSFSYGFTYDVFLSFKGTDTRYGFTGNLYIALCDRGSTPSLTIGSFMEVMKSHQHLSRPSKRLEFSFQYSLSIMLLLHFVWTNLFTSFTASRQRAAWFCQNGYECEFIREIVKYVSNKTNHAPLHVADYPVGLQSRVLKVNSLLEIGSNDEVKMLGIYGPEVYNSIADQFECVCFLHNVRENSAKRGLEHFQKEFLSKTIGLDIKLGDISEGIPIIK